MLPKPLHLQSSVPGRGWCTVLQLGSAVHLQGLASCRPAPPPPPSQTVRSCREAPTGFPSGQHRFDPQSLRLTEKHFFIKKKEKSCTVFRVRVQLWYMMEGSVRLGSSTGILVGELICGFFKDAYAGAGSGSCSCSLVS